MFPPLQRSSRKLELRDDTVDLAKVRDELTRRLTEQRDQASAALELMEGIDAR